MSIVSSFKHATDANEAAIQSRPICQSAKPPKVLKPPSLYPTPYLNLPKRPAHDLYPGHIHHVLNSQETAQLLQFLNFLQLLDVTLCTSDDLRNDLSLFGARKSFRQVASPSLSPQGLEASDKELKYNEQKLQQQYNKAHITTECMQLRTSLSESSATSKAYRSGLHTGVFVTCTQTLPSHTVSSIWNPETHPLLRPCTLQTAESLKPWSPNTQ